MSVEWPVAVRMLDLTAGLEELTGLDPYMRVRLFVRRGDKLVGSVDIETRGAPAVSVERLRSEIAEALGLRLFKHELRERLTTERRVAPLPRTSVSIILPSCDREDDLRRCLDALVQQQTRHALEIVVVDNRPSIGTARRVARQYPSVRIVDEPKPGLSYSRNTGILHATGAIVVATDDDVVAPPDWIEKLLQPFSRPEVAAVTGHVIPLQLDTEAQCRFEAYGGLGKGFVAREFTGEWFRTQGMAVPTWEIGATANAAFRASIFTNPAIGLLDEALGAGMPTGCSEDTDLFYRILKSGGTIVYTPDAYVWHRHRSSMPAVRQQIYAYSKGHVAYHLTTLIRDGDRRSLWRLGFSLPKTYLKRIVQRLRRRSDYPVPLLLLEIAGSFAGPIALWRARRRVRVLGSSVPLTERSHAVSLESPVPQDPAR